MKQNILVMRGKMCNFAFAKDQIHLLTMKKILFILASWVALAASAQQVSMMVMSDPHVMEKSLFDLPYGEAFLNSLQRDLKVNESSQQLFDSFVNLAIREKPQLLLVPGDLTKDGERVSHDYVARRLKEVEAVGTKVYVIPGNHDMENPLAYKYYGTKSERVPSVTEQEFRDIYRDFGYDEAVSVDSVTGSYIVYPVPGLAIIGINTNISNRMKSRYVHGRLFQPTLNWIERVSGEAKRDGRLVIAMSHHQMMQHHNQEDYFAPTAMTNMEKNVKGLPNIKKVQETLTRSGIHLVLTGHYHTQSVTDVETLHGKLTDVSTGSLAGFPSPYRRLSLNMKTGKMRVTSATLFGNKPTQWPTSELASREMDRLRYMVQVYVPRLPGVKTDLTDAYQYLATSYNKALCALAAGDETGHKPKEIYTECMEATDRYIRHVLMYNAAKVNTLRQQKDGPYRRASDLINSIMYNYVGQRQHVNADNALTINLAK